MLSPEDRRLLGDFRASVKAAGVSPEVAAEDAGEGMSGATARRLLEKTPSRLTSAVRRAMRGYVERHAAQPGSSRVHVVNTREDGEVEHLVYDVPEAVAGEGPSSVPGYNLLLEIPREIFEGWFYEMKSRGVPDEEVHQLATETIGPLARVSTLYQHGREAVIQDADAQLDVIRGMREVIRTQLRSRGM